MGLAALDFTGRGTSAKPKRWHKEGSELVALAAATYGNALS